MEAIKKYRGPAMRDKIDRAEKAALATKKPKKKAAPKKSVRKTIDDDFWG